MNVAPGVGANDAVTVAQLQAAVAAVVKGATLGTALAPRPQRRHHPRDAPGIPPWPSQSHRQGDEKQPRDLPQAVGAAGASGDESRAQRGPNRLAIS